MYSWYNGRRIKRHYTIYDQVDEKYINQLLRISEDTSVPKSATHSVYIVKANNKFFLESKKSLIPFSNELLNGRILTGLCVLKGQTSLYISYETTMYAPKKIFRINIRAGFKLGIHTDKYVNLIANELNVSVWSI